MREYLSFSQFDLWNKSKAQYIKKYFENEPQFETKELKFGKQFSELLESRAIENATYLDEGEVRLEGIIKGVKTLGFLDNSKSDLTEIIEYKTGKTEWTQERANNHKQLDMYACAIYNKFGIIPKITLEWHETIDDIDGSIQLTGNVKKFEVTKTLEDMQKISDEVNKTWQEILSAYENWKLSKENKIDLTQFYEYAEISKSIEELTEKQKQLKSNLKLPDEGVKLEGIGSFYYTTKKTKEETPKELIDNLKQTETEINEWIIANLPNELTEKKEAQQKAIKEFEEKAKIVSETKTINFRK